MNIEEFAKIKAPIDLIHINGGQDTNSTWAFNYIVSITEKMISMGETNTKIKLAVDKFLSNYIIDDGSANKKAIKLLTEWGFKFAKQ